MQDEVSVDWDEISQSCETENHKEARLTHYSRVVHRLMKDQNVPDPLIDHESPNHGEDYVKVAESVSRNVRLLVRDDNHELENFSDNRYFGRQAGPRNLLMRV